MNCSDVEDILEDFDKRLSEFDAAEPAYEQELPDDILSAIGAAGEVRDHNLRIKGSQS